MYAYPIPEALIASIDYKDGKLYWVDDGKRADVKGANGYRRVSWFGRGYKAHRVIWAWHNGDTELEIDHKNRERSDNRIGNLRAVERSTNVLNTEATMVKRLGVRYWSPQEPLCGTERTTE